MAEHEPVDGASIALALVQMDLTAGVDASLERADALLSEARRQGAAMALLPELFPFPWFPVTEDASHFRLAEPGGGEVVSAMRDMAQRHQMTVVVPTYEKDAAEPGARFNTTFIIDRSGEVVGRYRKNHIPYHAGWYEKFYYRPGNLGFPVFVQGGMRFGIQTCWDNLFPEGSRLLGLNGVHLILAPRGTGADTLQRWRTALSANALANNCFVATVNRTGVEGGRYRFGGDSAVFGPDGEVLAAATEANQVVVARVKKVDADLSRAEWPLRDDRRPELYRELVR